MPLTEHLRLYNVHGTVLREREPPLLVNRNIGTRIGASGNGGGRQLGGGDSTVVKVGASRDAFRERLDRRKVGVDFGGDSRRAVNERIRNRKSCHCLAFHPAGLELVTDTVDAPRLAFGASELHLDSAGQPKILANHQIR